MTQPKWKLTSIMNGNNGFIFSDETEVYAPEMELHVKDVDDWKVYRISMELCYHVNGCLSANQFHKDMEEWFGGDRLKEVADHVGCEVEELIEDLCHNDHEKRAMGYNALVSKFGPFEFDQYPLVMTNEENEARRQENRYQLNIVFKCEYPAPSKAMIKAMMERTKRAGQAAKAVEVKKQ